MSNYEVVNYFVQQIQWISSAVEAMLKRSPMPPLTEQPGGKVGELMESIKQLSTIYKKLENQLMECTEKEKEYAKTLTHLQVQLNSEKEKAANFSALEVNLKRSERRIEELISANHALKGHSHYLTEQLNSSKEALSSKTQAEQRLSLREMELKQASEKKEEVESIAEDLRKQMDEMTDQLEEESHALQSIQKIGEIMSIALQPEEVLMRVCQIPIDFIGCKRSATFLLDLNSDCFVPIHSRGMQTALLAAFKALKFREHEMPLLQELRYRKRPIVIDDCRKFPSKARVYIGNGSTEAFDSSSPLVSKEYVEKFGTPSLLAIPFISKGKVLGVMLMDYGSIQHRFSDTEISSMDGFGQLIGAALDNIRTYQETSKRLLSLERNTGTSVVLKEIEEAVFSTNEVELIFGAVISMVPRAMGSEWVSVLLVDKLADGFYVLGNLGNLIRGKGMIPSDQTNFNGVLRVDQVLYRPNLQSEGNLSQLDHHLLSHGIGSDIIFPVSVGEEIIGVLHISSRRVAGFSHEDIIIGQKISRMLSEALKRATAQRVEDRRKGEGYFEMIRGLIESVSQKDFRLGDYRDQMIACGIKIARGVSIDSENQDWIKYAIVLHDIGKSTIPSHILNKKDILTDKETAVLRSHPVQGAEIIKNFRFSELIRGMKFVESVVPLIRHSYERWDGTGYPDGLAGEKIPQGSRILSVVNAYSAMMADRPYRKALRVEEALREIQEGAGNQFDPRVVELFLQYFQAQKN